MNTMKEINFTDMENVRGGAGFDPFTGTVIPDQIIPGRIFPQLNGVRDFWEPIEDLILNH